MRWLAIVALALLLLPPAVDASLALAGELGIWTRLGIDPEPNVGTWWSPLRVLLLAGFVLVVRWLLRARERVVIEEFVDYTSEDAQAVKGLATLLVTELGRLRDLYGRVNDQLSTPTSVGVPAQGGARGTEPGAFLSVRADDVSEALKGAVATEAKLDVGPVRIPVGPLLAGLGRLVRGPRVLGSVHRTEAGGGPTLTTQIAGLAGNFTWRVDGPHGAVGAASKAFLNPMVSELALRMFTDLTLQRSIRWRAVRAFTAYLELYWDSLRTPRDRASNLKRAEACLLEAVAEDETFDLAYYNLGVVYSQLAQAETRAAEGSDYVGRGPDPEVGFRGRTEAATVAFSRAGALNRERPEAFYGLAVTTFAIVLRRDARGDSVSDEERRRRLRRVVHLCRRVIELDPDQAQAHDLKGLAEQELKRPLAALRSHRRAVSRSWRRLCRLEYLERVRPDAADTTLPGARANAAVALQNLANAHACASVGRGPIGARTRFFRADRLFHQALSLTPAGVRATTLLERGRIRERGGHPTRAAQSYLSAAQADPDNPVYWAHLRRAQARRIAGLQSPGRVGWSPWRNQQRDLADAVHACVPCETVLGLLAPIYRRTIEPHALLTSSDVCQTTLQTLIEAAKILSEDDESKRIEALVDLHGMVRAADRESTDGDSRAALTTLQGLEVQYGKVEDRRWEYEQIAVALGRAYGRHGCWPDAACLYEGLIENLKRWRPEGIPQHALYAKHARALRKSGKLEEALKRVTSGVVQNPLSATIRRELGKAHFALMQFDEALAAWEHTLWLTPNDPVLHWKVGYCHWCIAQDRQERASRQEALASAARDFGQAVLLSGPERLDCWAWSKLWLGRVCLEQRDTDAAVEHLRAAKGTDVTALAARLFLGEVHLASGEIWLSRHRLDHVYEQANHQVRNGHGEDLVDDRWGRSLSVREVAARARFGLAYWTAIVEGDRREGLAMAKEAEGLAREVDNVRGHALTLARCLDLQARIHAGDGDLNEAIARSRQAAALHPASDILLHELHLYEAKIESAGKYLDRATIVLSAKAMVQSIRRLEADGEPAREADELLERLEKELVSSPPSSRAEASITNRLRRFAGRRHGQDDIPPIASAEVGMRARG